MLIKQVENLELHHVEILYMLECVISLGSSTGLTTGGHRCVFGTNYRDIVLNPEQIVKNRSDLYTLFPFDEGQHMKLTQAILPVAGLGTRFLPWTKVVPKELLPIGNQPIIALLVDECLSVGINDICFVINRGKEAIPQYFYSMPGLEQELTKRGKSHLLEELARYHNVNFHVVYQDELHGDGHALLQARDWIKGEMTAVLFGDDLIAGKENGLQQLTKGLAALKDPTNAAMLCLQEVEKKLVSKYGIVEIEDGWQVRASHGDARDQTVKRIRKIRNLVEKPKPENAPSNLSIVGKYIIPKVIFEKLHQLEGGSHAEIRLIDALIAEKDAIDIYGYVFEGQRLDTGTPEGYKEAVRVLG